jgi:hypothetical protein
LEFNTMVTHTYARLVESVRRTRNTMYLVAGLYIMVGFVVAVATAFQRDRLGTFLGFIIISGALSMGLIVRTALQVLVRVGHIEKSLHGFAERVDQLIPLVLANHQSATATVQDADMLVDLTKVGAGQTHLLAAATLHRDVYPRLVVAMESAASESSALSLSSAASPGAPGSSTDTNGARTKDLLEQWKAAVAEEDLLACRRIYSTLIEFLDRDGAALLARQITYLEDDWERKLRDRFARQVRAREFVAALETGDQIAALLGGRAVAAEFLRLRPILARRADEMLTLSVPSR